MLRITAVTTFCYLLAAQLDGITKGAEMAMEKVSEIWVLYIY